MQRFFKIVVFVVADLFFHISFLKGQYIELQTAGAAILPSIHPSSNILLKQSAYRSAAVRFMWHADTAKLYSKINNCHLYGIGIYGATFQNKSIGDPLAIYFFIKTPLFCKRTWIVFYEIGSGIAGNLNPYHKELNPYNELIGSRLNMTGHLGLGIEKSFLKKFKVGFSVGYRHFSNGFIKWPNYGINIIPLTLTATYDISKNKTCCLKKEVPVFSRHNQFTIFYAPGSKNFGHGEKNYFVSTLGLLFIRQVSYKIGLGGGFDLFYKGSGKDKVQSEESDLGKMLSCGISASFDWIFTEKFRINTGLGFYLSRHPDNDESYPFYERISARYSVTKNVFTGIGIKINGNAADYIEWTMGYTFKRDKNSYK